MLRASRVIRPFLRPARFSVRNYVTLLGKSNVPSYESMGLMEPAHPVDPATMPTPMEYIASVPVIEVSATTAMCDGGGGARGHPVVYLQLNRIDPHEPATCKYCGLRFIQKHGH